MARSENRNENFSSEDEPFRDNGALQLNDDQINGPLWFLNPTQATFTYTGDTKFLLGSEGAEYTRRRSVGEGFDASEIEYKWTARNNRKGRHALVVRQTPMGKPEYDTPPDSTSRQAVLKGLWRMLRKFSIWDTSYVIAVVFVAGCVVLVLNAFLTFMPYADPNFKPPNEIEYATAVLAVLGSALFVVSTFLSFVEAVNADRQGCFGWKLEHFSYTDASDVEVEHGSTSRVVPDERCTHHHNNHESLITNSENSRPADLNEISAILRSDTGKSEGESSWKILPTMHELCTHYLYDLGFLACALLLCSSLVYCSTSIALLVSTLQPFNTKWIRIPQLLAAIGFATSSVLFMIETQMYWWLPATDVLGW